MFNAPAKRYRHEVLTIGGWESSGSMEDGDKVAPLSYDSLQEAFADISSFMRDINDQIKLGEREPDEGFDPSEFSVVDGVTGERHVFELASDGMSLTISSPMPSLSFSLHEIHELNQDNRVAIKDSRFSSDEYRFATCYMENGDHETEIVVAFTGHTKTEVPENNIDIDAVFVDGFMTTHETNREFMNQYESAVKNMVYMAQKVPNYPQLSAEEISLQSSGDIITSHASQSDFLESYTISRNTVGHLSAENRNVYDNAKLSDHHIAVSFYEDIASNGGVDESRQFLAIGEFIPSNAENGVPERIQIQSMALNGQQLSEEDVNKFKVKWQNELRVAFDHASHEILNTPRQYSDTYGESSLKMGSLG